MCDNNDNKFNCLRVRIDMHLELKLEKYYVPVNYKQNDHELNTFEKIYIFVIPSFQAIN